MVSTNLYAAEESWCHGRFGSSRGEPRLLFGRMYEDCRVETSVFTPGSRVVCIASAGCTAMALSKCGCRVTAVDVNRAQVEYVRRRLSGGPIEQGHAEQLLQRIRGVMRMVGVTPVDVRAFLQLDSTDEQARVWRDWLEGGFVGVLMRAAVSHGALRTVYDPGLLCGAPAGLGRVMIDRLSSGMMRHVNQNNPYAWRLLLGCECPGIGTDESAFDAGAIDVIRADMLDFLERRGDGIYDGFALSNILDGASARYQSRLWAAIQRVAAPGAKVVWRSFIESNRDQSTPATTHDRSLIWGSVNVEHVDRCDRCNSQSLIKEVQNA